MCSDPRRQLAPRQVVVGDDDVDPGREGALDRLARLELPQSAVTISPAPAARARSTWTGWKP